MARDIKALLRKKKKWTGEEVARASIASWCYEYEQAKNGVIDTEPLFTDAELQEHLNSIEDPAQGRRYNNLISIREWVAKSYSGAIAQQQQLQLYLTTLMNRVTAIRATEDTYKYLSQLPAIMTEKQYKELVSRRREEALHPEGETLTFTMLALLEEALNHYIRELQKKPRDRKNPLQPLKKKLEKERVTDPHILTRYNEVMGEGYYTTVDGVRSDEVTTEEWIEINKDICERIREDDSYSPEEAQQIIDDIVQARYITRVSALFNGATPEEADNIQTETDIKEGFSKRVTWHYYTDPPKDLTKWEILETGDLFEYYPTLAGENYSGKSWEESLVEDIEAFRKEFPTVVASLLKDMKKYFPDAPDLIEAPVEEWLTIGVEWEDLYSMDYYSFRSTYIDNDINYFDGNKRAILNGVAILRPSDVLNKSRCIDEDGNFKPPAIPDTFTELSIQSLFSESEWYAESIKSIEMERSLLLSSYYYLVGYDMIMDIIAREHDLPEFKTFKANSEYMAQRIEGLNGLFLVLFDTVNSIDYEDEELKEKKLEALRNFFYRLDYEAEKPTEQQIEYATSIIKDFKAFKENTVELAKTMLYKLPEEGV